ncbi:MAG: glycosyltransferase family 4 protein [Propionibacteriaceae bacterium]|nr:glycosyltransferase family 4 protein [Propionibacteriaceae bacterium]
MKFALFSAQYLPTIGGVERYTHYLAQALTHAGHEVTIIASQLPDTPISENEDAVKIVRVPSIPMLAGRYPLPRFNRNFRSLMKDIAVGNFDLALINTRFWALSLWAARACAKRGIPCIVLEHGSSYLTMGNYALNTIIRIYEHIAAWWMKRYASKFAAVSQQSASWLKTFAINDVEILYNAININQTVKQAAQGAWNVRDDFSIPASMKLIAFVGRLLPEKGIPELLEAMRVTQLTVPECVLIIAGEGPLHSQLEAHNQAGVIYVGGLTHERALSLLSQADIFCLPSHSEGFSTVVLEAGALGTFMVTTPVGGTPELILSKEYGGILPAHNEQTIAELLIEALTNDRWRHSAANKTRARVESTFTWDQTAQALISIARELVD